MNGAGAATAAVTGVVALMLEARNTLTVRDIKYILAKTARPVDPGFAGVSATDIIPGSSIVLEQGWVTNAAGYPFSNRYGFGSVDAAAAVAMAHAYAGYVPADRDSKRYTALPATATVPKSAAGMSLQFTVSEPYIQTVEYASVIVNIDASPGLPCNQIELTSPSGTKSILLHAQNGFTNTTVAGARLESNAFYGEQMNGTWTLRVYDFCVSSSSPTTLSATQPQTLVITGY
jgi:hypothetical protein